MIVVDLDHLNSLSALQNLKPVGGEGPRKPKLILCGEAPGDTEEQQGRPFVGAAGQELNRILTDAHVRREDCYVTNVVKIKPPNKQISKLSTYGVCVEDFYPSLKEELEKIDCSICVPLGDVALNALTGKDGIEKHRGSIYPSTLIEKLTCVPALHPAHIIRLWQVRASVVMDVKKAVRVGREGYQYPTFNTLIKPTLIEVESFVKELKELNVFSFDIEVVSGDQIA